MFALTSHKIFQTHLRLNLRNQLTQSVRITQDPQGFTLVHGDANLGNILSPHEGSGKTYLIDRQPFDWSLVIWPGVSDLAYFLGLWWQTEPRRQWEIPVLHHYHACLRQHGITDYAWDQLLWDYQLTLIQGLYIAAEWCILESDRIAMKWVWFRHLQRSMAAFFDHKGAKLWSSKEDSH